MNLITFLLSILRAFSSLSISLTLYLFPKGSREFFSLLEENNENRWKVDKSFTPILINGILIRNVNLKVFKEFSCGKSVEWIRYSKINTWWKFSLGMLIKMTEKLPLNFMLLIDWFPQPLPSFLFPYHKTFIKTSGQKMIWMPLMLQGGVKWLIKQQKCLMDLTFHSSALIHWRTRKAPRIHKKIRALIWKLLQKNYFHRKLGNFFSSYFPIHR